jgi:hypothetical protein
MKPKGDIVWIMPRPIPALLCAFYRGALMRPIPVWVRRA